MTDPIDEASALSIRLRQQAAIAEFGKHALRTHDLDAILQQACKLAADGLGIQQAKVLELLPYDRGLLVRAGVGWGPEVVGKAIIGADGGSPAGYALRTGEAVISEDLSRESRFKIPPVLQQHGIKSAINVLIQGDRQPFGVLEVDSRRLYRFTRGDADFLQSCANRVASAIDRLD
ncbi:MAG TPA: GAF domain-containing protein, partial [Vicinamibacterales bacterium]|nr:GAF domain-containing protein [Vicinamibacterales bacterium]